GDRREIERRHHHLGPTRIVERLRDDRQGHRDAGRERDFLWPRTDHPAVALPQLRERGPPDVVPRGCPPGLPQVEKLRGLPARAVAQRRKATEFLDLWQARGAAAWYDVWW